MKGIVFDQESTDSVHIVENQNDIDEDEYDHFRRGVNLPYWSYYMWAVITAALFVGMFFAIIQFREHRDDAHQGYQTGICVANETMASPFRDHEAVIADCEEYIGVDVSEGAGWW